MLPCCLLSRDKDERSRAVGRRQNEGVHLGRNSSKGQAGAPHREDKYLQSAVTTWWPALLPLLGIYSVFSPGSCSYSILQSSKKLLGLQLVLTVLYFFLLCLYLSVSFHLSVSVSQLLCPLSQSLSISVSLFLSLSSCPFLSPAPSHFPIQFTSHSFGDFFLSHLSSWVHHSIIVFLSLIQV